jgi:2-polyprenyl-3-methyl-5-hydroxy-6-metoxy-1,4-benzoquinol methylase
MTLLASLKCRLCDNTTLSKLYRSNQHDLLKCSICGLVQVKDKPSMEELNKIYELSYFSHNKYKDARTLEYENKRRLDFVKQYASSSQETLLEAGCGAGNFLSIAKHEYTVSGFDLSEAGVKIARDNNPDISERIWSQPLEELDQPSESFDIICMWDVIEHIWDPYSTCENLFRYLKPNGLLFLSTPNIGALTAHLMKQNWAFMTPPEHLSFFDKHSMHYLFQEKLAGSVDGWESKGKLVNIGFLFYKIKRKFPDLVPEAVLKFWERKPMSNWAIYVPTGDIQYVAICKA